MRKENANEQTVRAAHISNETLERKGMHCTHSHTHTYTSIHPSLYLDCVCISKPEDSRMGGRGARKREAAARVERERGSRRRRRTRSGLGEGGESSMASRHDIQGQKADDFFREGKLASCLAFPVATVVWRKWRRYSRAGPGRHSIGWRHLLFVLPPRIGDKTDGEKA